MNCPSCGRQNASDSAFCNKCGAALEIVCASCARKNPPDSSFCAGCGQRLTPAAQPAAVSPRSYTPRHLAEKILRERAALEGERRTVTVLFCDASGFTPLSERIDAEEVYGLMQGCLALMMEAVHRYEGTVTQFTGDGVMALFGAPIAHEDAARRAVAAALEMQEMLPDYAGEFQKRHPVECRFRVGLNTGPVVVGKISDNLDMDYTALGDTVNLASRMEDLAEPGSVYLTEETYRQAGAYFDCEPLGALVVKGKAAPVVAYRAVREKSAVRTRLQAQAERGLTPFVGRAQELNFLRGYFDQVKRGRGHVVFVTGEAGLGKSRLLLEFRRSVLDEPLTWLEGHCISYGKRIPYLPITELVKRNFGVEESDSEDQIIAKVDAGSQKWDAAPRATVPYLKYLLSVDPGDEAVAGMDPMERRAGILDALRALLSQESRERSLVVVIEDLHWVDEKSQEAISAMVDAIQSMPVFMVLTYRPGYAHGLGDRTYYSRLALSQLAAEEGAAIAERVLQVASLPEPVRVLITSKGEGNPFYIEEVTRSLVESGVLRANNGSYALERPVEQVRVPDTIQEVILSRIDRLEREAKEAMQLASVIGREFTVRLLDRISDIEARLDDLLSELKSLELIYEKAYFPELAYMFKHALTHDVAYSTLLVERRKKLHRLVGAAIEELYSDRLAEQYEALAHHYSEAQDWEKALEYLEKAGDKASAAYANEDAADYYARALEICERLGAGADRVIELHGRRGKAFARMGRWADARPEIEAALAGLPQERLDRRAELLAILADVYFWLLDTPNARRYATETLELAKKLGRDDLAVSALSALAGADGADGDLASSLEGYERAVERAHGLSTAAVAFAFQQSTLTLYWTGKVGEAAERGHESINLARDINDILNLMNALPHTGLALAAMGRYDEAARLFEEAREIGRKYMVRTLLARSIAISAGFHMDVFDFHGAEALQEEAREMARTLNFAPPQVSAGIDLLLNFARQREAGPAGRLLDEVAQAAGKGSGWHGWLWKLRLAEARAEIALARGDWEAAFEWAGRAIVESEAKSRTKYQAAGLTSRGSALAGMGRHKEAIPELRRAVQLATKMGDPALLLRAATPLLSIEPDEALVSETGKAVERIARALPGEEMRRRFEQAEPVRQIKRLMA